MEAAHWRRLIGTELERARNFGALVGDFGQLALIGPIWGPLGLDHLQPRRAARSICTIISASLLAEPSRERERGASQRYGHDWRDDGRRRWQMQAGRPFFRRDPAQALRAPWIAFD